MHARVETGQFAQASSGRAGRTRPEGGRTLSAPGERNPVALEHLGTPEAPTFGLDTFGDRGTGADGRQVTHAEAIRQVVTEGQLADELGVEFFGVGAHHRDDFAVSAPDVVLATLAGRTSRIRLG